MRFRNNCLGSKKMRPPIPVKNIEEINNIDFEESAETPVAIAFSSDFSFPLKPNAQYSEEVFAADGSTAVITALRFAETGIPIGRRIVYRHPGRYDINSFSDDVKELFEEKLRHGQSYTKQHRGILIFSVDSENELSIFNACCVLGYYFCECHNEKTDISHEYHYVTLVPYPFLLTEERLPGFLLDYTESQRQLIWDAHWFPDNTEVDGHTPASINGGKHNFPNYSNVYFPVVVLDYIKDGVTSFAVNTGSGAIIVVPSSMNIDAFIDRLYSFHAESSAVGFDLCRDLSKFYQNSIFESTGLSSPHENLNIEILSFPKKIILGNNIRSVEISLNQSVPIKVTPLRFLRFMLIYLSSHHNNYFKFKQIRYGIVTEIESRGCPFDSIFKSADGSYISNLRKDIERIIDSFIPDDIGRFCENKSENGYQYWRLKNIKLRICISAKEKFEKSFLEQSQDKSVVAFDAVFDSFKTEILNSFHHISL